MRFENAERMLKTMSLADEYLPPGLPVVRNMTIADLGELFEMYQDYFPKKRAMGLPPAKESMLRKWVENLAHEKLNVIAETDGKIVGHASIIDIPGKDFCEFMFFVHQDYRWRGIGSVLTLETCKRALVLGKNRIWLVVESENTGAIIVLYNIGFRITRVWSDTYEMEMDLVAPAEMMSL
jgi:L-amino acid N-acyltransferase